MRAEPRYKTTVRLIGPLFNFINYFDSQSGGRDSAQRPIVASSGSCLNPFHAGSVNLDCKDIKGSVDVKRHFQAKYLHLVQVSDFRLGTMASHVSITPVSSSSWRDICACSLHVVRCSYLC